MTRGGEKKKQEEGKVESFESNKMSKPNYSGTYHMVDQDNMDGYLAALGKTLRVALLSLLLNYDP